MDRLFKLKENNTTVKNELIGGVTTFLSMAYILVDSICTIRTEDSDNTPEKCLLTL